MAVVSVEEAFEGRSPAERIFYVLTDSEDDTGWTILEKDEQHSPARIPKVFDLYEYLDRPGLTGMICIRLGWEKQSPLRFKFTAGYSAEVPRAEFMIGGSGSHDSGSAEAG